MIKIYGQAKICGRVKLVNVLYYLKSNVSPPLQSLQVLIIRYIHKTLYIHKCKCWQDDNFLYSHTADISSKNIVQVYATLYKAIHLTYGVDTGAFKAIYIYCLCPNVKFIKWLFIVFIDQLIHCISEVQIMISLKILRFE